MLGTKNLQSPRRLDYVIGIGLLFALGENLMAHDDQKQSVTVGAVLDPWFCFDGRRLLARDGDFIPNGNDVVLWDTQTGKELQRFRGHKDEIHAVTFSPDGKTVLTGGGGTEISADDSARLWDVTTGKEIRKFEGHTGFVHTIQFSRNGESILTADGDSMARLWDVSTGKELQKFPDVYPLHPSASFDPDGGRVLGLTRGGGRATLWSVDRGGVLLTIESDKKFFRSAVFNPSGSEILTSLSDHTARSWNATTGLELRVFSGHASDVQQAQFTDGGKRVVTASADGTVRFWDAESGKETRRIEYPGADVYQIAVSPDGKRVLARWRAERKNARIETGVTLSDAGTGKTILERPDNLEPELMGFSPDGKEVLEIKGGRPAGVRNAATGEVLRSFHR